jgi:hypothetical protein
MSSETFSSRRSIRRTRSELACLLLNWSLVDLRGKLAEVEDAFNQGWESGLNIGYSCGENVQAVIDHFKVLGSLLPEIEHIPGEFVDACFDARNGGVKTPFEPFEVGVDAVSLASMRSILASMRSNRSSVVMRIPT